MNAYLLFRHYGPFEIAVIRTIVRLATPPTPTAAIIAVEVEKQRKLLLHSATLHAAVEEIRSSVASHAVEVRLDSSFIVSLPVKRVGLFILDYVTTFRIGFPGVVIQLSMREIDWQWKSQGKSLGGFCRMLDCSCAPPLSGVERMCTMCGIAVCKQCVVGHQGTTLRLSRGHCMCDIHPSRPMWARRS